MNPREEVSHAERNGLAVVSIGRIANQTGTRMSAGGYTAVAVQGDTRWNSHSVARVEKYASLPSGIELGDSNGLESAGSRTERLTTWFAEGRVTLVFGRLVVAICE